MTVVDLLNGVVHNIVSSYPGPDAHDRTFDLSTRSAKLPSTMLSIRIAFETVLGRCRQ